MPSPRNYLDVITDLPWERIPPTIDLSTPAKCWTAITTGWPDVKDRIVEFLAVGALKGQVGGSIILLGRPAGRRQDLDRPLGGRRAGSPVLPPEFGRDARRGRNQGPPPHLHRRVAGRSSRPSRDAKTANPVIMLDEIDKIGASFHGDPASALLEALDPEQNTEFLDHYLDVRFRSFQGIVHLHGQPARHHSGAAARPHGNHPPVRLHHRRKATDRPQPPVAETAGAQRPGADRIQVEDSALTQIIEGYAREAGVRNLEKQLGRIVRKSAVKIVEERPKDRSRWINPIWNAIWANRRSGRKRG